MTNPVKFHPPKTDEFLKLSRYDFSVMHNSILLFVITIIKNQIFLRKKIIFEFT